MEKKTKNEIPIFSKNFWGLEKRENEQKNAAGIIHQTERQQLSDRYGEIFWIKVSGITSLFQVESKKSQGRVWLRKRAICNGILMDFCKISRLSALENLIYNNINDWIIPDCFVPIPTASFLSSHREQNAPFSAFQKQRGQDISPCPSRIFFSLFLFKQKKREPETKQKKSFFRRSWFSKEKRKEARKALKIKEKKKEKTKEEEGGKPSRKEEGKKTARGGRCGKRESQEKVKEGKEIGS